MSVSGKFIIYVTHVEETDSSHDACLKFWAQKERIALSYLDSCLKSLSNHFENSPAPENLHYLYGGQMLCAFIDNIWIRVRLLNPNQSRSEQLDVFCVDYGKVCSVHKEQIRVLPSFKTREVQFLEEYSPFVSRFILKDFIIPKPILESSLCYLQKNFVNQYWNGLSAGMDGDWEKIELFSASNTSLATDLIKKGIGLAPADFESELSPNGTGQVDVRQEAGGTSLILNHESRNPDRLLVLPNSNTIGTSAAIRSKVWSPAKPESNESGTKRLAFTKTAIPKSSIQDVTVVKVDKGIEKFIIQLNDHQAELLELGRQLQSVDLKPMLEYSRGNPCIALSAKENFFRRGLITVVVSKTSCYVYYVDYGEMELVETCFLFHIPEELVATPIYGVRVALAEPEGLELDDGVTEIFTKLVEGKSFRCQVESEEPLTVHLSDVTTGRDIKDSIISIVNANAKRRNSTASTVSTSSTLTAATCRSSTSNLRSIFRVSLKVPSPRVLDEENLTVTYVTPVCLSEPFTFFGRLARRSADESVDVMNELEEVYGNLSEPPLLYEDVQCHLGDFGVIRWSEGFLYCRVTVKEELAQEVVVFLIDFGNIVAVPRSQVYAPVNILKHFTLPAFGIKCRTDLRKYYQLNYEQWVEVMNHQLLHVRITSCSGDIYDVAFTKSAHNMIEARARLVKDTWQSEDSPNIVVQDFDESGEVVAVKKPGPAVAEKPKTNPLAGDRLLLRFNLNVGSNNRNGERTSGLLDVITPDGNVSDDDNDRRDPRRRLSYPDGRTPTDDEDLSPEEIAATPEINIQDFSAAVDEPGIADRIPHYPKQPNLWGTRKSCSLVFFVNPHQIYCHLEEDFETLDRMMERLQSVYGTGGGVQPKTLAVGMACVVLFEGKSLDLEPTWNRAQLLSVNNNTAELFFIDYGHSHHCAVHHIRAIEDEFLTEPAMAYHCRLTGIDAPETWTDDNILQFIEDAKVCEATFFSHGVRLERTKNCARVVLNELFGYPKMTGVPPPAEDYSSMAVPLQAVDVTTTCFTDLNEFVLSPADLSAYKVILEELKNFYSSIEISELEETEPSVGLPCVACFFINELFYRAEILEVDPPNARVVFVDYGNEDYLPLIHLKRILPRFMTFPKLAWRCSLAEVEVVPEKQAEACADQRIASAFSGEVLSAVFQQPSADGVYPVKLDFCGMGSVTSYLLDQGFVVERQLPPEAKIFEPEETISTEAVVPFIVSPTKFWIQLQPDEVDLLMEKVAQVTTQPDDLPALDTLTPGCLCLALFPQDGNWYRAVIDETDGDRVKVMYIDYGNGGFVDRSQLRRLPHSLRQCPASALKCSLEGVEDLVEVDKLFQSLALDLTFTVKFVRLVADCSHVRLYDAGGTDMLQILTQHSVTEANSPEQVDIPPDVKTEPLDVVENPPDLLKRVEAAEEQPKLTECQPEPQKKVPEEEVPQELENRLELAASEPPNTPASQEFYISLLESPCRFWIQLASNGSYIGDIQDGIESLKLEKVAGVAVGDVVLARHVGYDEWYRAQVKSLCGNGVRVYFIDYGGFLSVAMADICKCPKVFQRIPWMAIKCSMSTSLLAVYTAEKMQLLKEVAEGNWRVCTGVFGLKHGDVQLIESLQLPRSDPSRPVESIPDGSSASLGITMTGLKMSSSPNNRDL